MHAKALLCFSETLSHRIFLTVALKGPVRGGTGEAGSCLPFLKGNCKLLIRKITALNSPQNFISEH